MLLLDLKPAVLSAAAALAFVWDPTPYLVNSSGTGADVGVPNRTANQSQELFLQAWAEQQFSGLKTEKDGSQNSSSGDDTLQRIVQLWRGYFELPWVARGQSDEMLGGSIGGIASSLAADLAHNFSVSAKTATEADNGRKLAMEGLAQATSLHMAAAELLVQLPVHRQQFWRSHMLLQSAIQRFAVETIDALSNATLTLVAAGAPIPTHAAVAEANEAVSTALNAMDQLFAAERDAEGVEEWRGLYWADRHRFTNFQARRRQILALQSALRKIKYTPATQIDCCQMEYAYQWSPAHLASYPLFYDNPSLRARDFILCSCNATTDGGSCANTVGGGNFHNSAMVTLALPVVAGAPTFTRSTIGVNSGIEYRTCGEEARGSVRDCSGWQPYTRPIQLKATTELQARKVDCEEASTGGVCAQERIVTFTKLG